MHLLFLPGDMELNPVPAKSSSITSFCHWNLNEPADDRSFDVACSSEMFLDSSMLQNDENV